MKASGNGNGDLEFTVNADVPPKLPEGDYEVAFLRAEKWSQRGRAKGYLWFQITAGQFTGCRLYMAFTIPDKGKWGHSHKFYRAHVLAAETCPRRGDRISTAAFRHKRFLARVRTVEVDFKQRRRAPHEQYSVIDELTELVAGGGNT